VSKPHIQDELLDAPKDLFLSELSGVPSEHVGCVWIDTSRYLLRSRVLGVSSGHVGCVWLDTGDVGRLCMGKRHVEFPLADGDGTGLTGGRDG
jgi:hypothetical protein